MLEWQQLEFETDNSNYIRSFLSFAYAITNKTEIETELFCYPRRTLLMLTCVFGRYVASTVLLAYPNLSKGADSVSG